MGEFDKIEGEVDRLFEVLTYHDTNTRRAIGERFEKLQKINQERFFLLLDRLKIKRLFYDGTLNKNYDTTTNTKNP